MTIYVFHFRRLIVTHFWQSNRNFRQYPFLLKKKKQEAHNFHFERLKMLILLADAVWKEKPLHEMTQKKIVKKTQKINKKWRLSFISPFKLWFWISSLELNWAKMMSLHPIYVAEFIAVSITSIVGFCQCMTTRASWEG